MMQEYEYVAVKALHEKLKEKINAKIYVIVTKDGSLFVCIDKEHIHYKEYFDNITYELLGGSFAEKFCDAIVKDYKKFVLSKYFY